MWYEKFCQFMVANNFMTVDDAKKELEEFRDQIIQNGKESVKALSGTTPDEKIFNLIKSSISTGAVILVNKPEDSVEGKNKVVIGRELDEIICINPEAAIQYADFRLSRSGGFKTDKDTLTKAFDKKGLLVEKDKKGKLLATRIGKQVIGCWAFSKKSLGYSTEEVDLKSNRMKLIPLYIDQAVQQLNLNGAKNITEKSRAEIRTNILERMRLTEDELVDYSDLIDLAMDSYFKAKGWVITYAEAFSNANIKL